MGSGVPGRFVGNRLNAALSALLPGPGQSERRLFRDQVRPKGAQGTPTVSRLRSQASVPRSLNGHGTMTHTEHGRTTTLLVGAAGPWLHSDPCPSRLAVHAGELVAGSRWPWPIGSRLPFLPEKDRLTCRCHYAGNLTARSLPC